MKAILVDVIHPETEIDVAQQRLQELASLTTTFGGLTIVRTVQKRAIPDYTTYVGSGKLEHIVGTAKALGGEIVILNNLLKPRQLYTIQERLRPHGLRAWDRIDLILHIFQKHAKTREAKLQIRLAAIRHMGPRIFDMGIEMGQQGAGIGTRGKGETNTEIMKRHLRDTEKHIQKQLAQAARSRKLHRDDRKRRGFLTASIVGYTNAGKSSLLNALTHKGAYVADALFATLDTRVGKLWLPELQKTVLLSDTIGFIQNLPPQLIDAFRSTLEETIDADIILHVMDASDPAMDRKREAVLQILSELGVEETPRIPILNKMDCAHPENIRKNMIRISATERVGLETLTTKISQTVANVQLAMMK